MYNKLIEVVGCSESTPQEIEIETNLDNHNIVLQEIQGIPGVYSNDEIKNLAEVLIAYSEGRPIQRIDTSCYPSKWEDTNTLSLHLPYIHYRVKPIFKHRPYISAYEFVKAQKVYGPYIKEKGTDNFYNPYFADDHILGIASPTRTISYSTLLDEYEWQNGEKCGVKTYSEETEQEN